MVTRQLLLLCLIILSFSLSHISLADSSSHDMPALKNLSNVDFVEKNEIEKFIDELTDTATNPYLASFPLIMSAQLGDTNRYEKAQEKFMTELYTPEHYAEWMKKYSFIAWIFGRSLFAADSINDKNAENILAELLPLLNPAKKDNLAFYTWAEGYYAGLKKENFLHQIESMLKNTDQLIEQYKTDKTQPGALSDALWACVMDMQAAANAGDHIAYEQIKKKIISLVKVETVTDGLSKGLLRTATSNDYPAWAMAIVRRSAAIIEDKELYLEINDTLLTSIKNAKIAGAKAEYALAILNNQLAITK